MRIDEPFDSVIKHLGTTKLIKVNGIDSNYIGFFYPKIIAWRNNGNNHLCGLDILDASIATRRGLKIGDLAQRIESLYGKPLWIGKRYDFLGPYEYPFRDYSKAWLYVNGDYHFVVLARGSRIVRMMLYRELWLETEDYNVEFLKLGDPFDSVISHLGKPDRIEPFEEGSAFTGFHYPKLVLWRDDTNKSLCAFDVYDSSLATNRGLRIGDSIQKIKELYGNRTWVEKDFGRAGPYDYTFKDYSQATIYGASTYLIFFTKGQRLVKILSYIGVDE